ncbi:MAG: ThiF family adenylyltransferase [Planctomycetes bacterium]|nr:ThiF family adenylyltransferase [Planctomycetota bacterium]
MAGKQHHESLYRGEEAIRKLAEARVTLCGAGALGSHLADALVRQGVRRLRVIDRDRVEEHNIGTQLFGEGDVGAWKADVLRSYLFRATGVEIESQRKDLSERTVRKLLKDADVVIDAFDNSASRRLVQEHCRDAGLRCLHAGLYADYGEVIWNEQYRVPSDAGQDVCDYPLARNLVLLTVAVAADTLVRFICDGEQQNWSITLRDFAVRPLEN